MHCSGVTSDNGPAVNDHAVTSRNCVLYPRKNETLDVVTSKLATQISNFKKTHSVMAELFNTDGRTDGQRTQRRTDMTLLIVALRNFLKALKKNCSFYSLQDRRRTQKLPTRKNIRYAIYHDRRFGFKWLNCKRTRCNCIQGGYFFFTTRRSVQICRFSVL